MDLFFPRAKKRRKARVDLREREVSLSLLCAKHRTKLSVPANLLLFRRKKSFQYWCPPKKAESLALPSRRARTKKTRLEDAGRRDVPFFTRTKSLSRGRDSFRAACVCALFCDVSRLFVRFPPVDIFLLFGGKRPKNSHTLNNSMRFVNLVGNLRTRVFTKSLFETLSAPEEKGERRDFSRAFSLLLLLFLHVSKTKTVLFIIIIINSTTSRRPITWSTKTPEVNLSRSVAPASTPSSLPRRPAVTVPGYCL